MSAASSRAISRRRLPTTCWIRSYAAERRADDVSARRRPPVGDPEAVPGSVPEKFLFTVWDDQTAQRPLETDLRPRDQGDGHPVAFWRTFIAIVTRNPLALEALGWDCFHFYYLNQHVKHVRGEFLRYLSAPVTGGHPGSGRAPLRSASGAGGRIADLSRPPVGQKAYETRKRTRSLSRNWPKNVLVSPPSTSPPTTIVIESMGCQENSGCRTKSPRSRFT